MSDAIDRKYAALASVRRPVLENPLDPGTANWRILADFIEDVMVQQAGSQTDASGWQAQADLIRAQCLHEEAIGGPDTYCSVCGWTIAGCLCPHQPWHGALGTMAAVIAWHREQDYPLSARVWNDPGEEEFLIAYGFRRGLVDSVTLSLTTFLSHWALLFDRHPITQVMITTEPEVYSVRAGTVLGHPVEDQQYAWRRSDSPPSPSRAGGVPSWVFKHLTQNGDETIDTVVYPSDSSPHLAQLALGDACVAAAREQLNLPKLPRRSERTKEKK